MITTDQAFDMLPHVVKMYEKLDLKEYIQKNKETISAGTDPEKTKKMQDEKGHDLIVFVLRNAAKIKAEVFKAVAIMQNVTPEEIRKQSFMKTLKQLKELLEDKELMDFFSAAM